MLIIESAFKNTFTNMDVSPDIKNDDLVSDDILRGF